MAVVGNFATFAAQNQKMCGNSTMIPNYKRNMAQEDVFKKIVSHCKEYGFVFPSSDIYDGLAAVYVPKHSPRTPGA